jgi:hypothetical protein
MTTLPLVQTCRGCGCTDEQACFPTCAWVEPDLCSKCAETLPTVSHDEVLESIGGWVLASPLPHQLVQPVHDLVAYTVAAHAPTVDTDDPNVMWCDACTDASAGRDTLPRAVAWPCTAYRLALAVLGQRVVDCDHHLGSLPCINHKPHPGNGRGCIHEGRE